MNQNIKPVDQYISEFPVAVQVRLKKMRIIIKKNAPEAIEDIAYGIPAYKLYKKPLVYFGGFEKYIGFYATPSTHQQLKQELSGYKQGKGSVQFPHNETLPWKLIAQMVIIKVAENKIQSDLEKKI